MIFTTDPYDHQREALGLSINKYAYALFLEQGTGKSKIIIDEIVNLIELDKINSVIILAPNGVHINWKSEFLKHGPLNYDKWAIQVWNTGTALKKKEDETKEILASKKVLVFLMNIEALSSQNGIAYLKRVLLARRRVYMAIDESHKIKTARAQRTKAAIELGKFATYKRIATGTEAEEGLEDLFSQFKFLDDNIIGIRSYVAFRSMYCIMGGFENRQIKGYQNKDMLARRISPYIYQKRKKDCLDLPDKVYVTHEIELTTEQKRTYDQLENELIMELKSGTIVDATQAMTKVMRLQQVLCGHVGAIDQNEGIKVDEFIPSNRANYVAELVEEASGKVIVFCRFIRDVDLVISALGQNRIRAIGLSSRIEGPQRMLEIDRWRHDKDIKVLAITIATGGTGLTLNEANTTIFYSNSWSSTDRLQAEDRNHRIGQINKVTYHDLIVKKHIDHRLLNALKKKQSLANDFRDILNIQKFLTDDFDA